MKSQLKITPTGRILYGADYNPDQWLDEPAVLDEDIALMKRLGVTSASVGIFSWTSLEPAEGQFCFTWLDSIMDRFAKEGLLVFLATPSGSKPMWLSEAYPEIRRVNKEGIRDASGGRHNHCPTSPVYRDRVTRINRELAQRYAGHPALALWHIGNELNGECHCDLCRKAFQQWLQKRYGDLDALNRAWWTTFWNHTFTAWDQIPTHDPSIDALYLDWRRFMNDQHVSFLETEMAPLRELTPDIPCTTNFMGTNGPTNYWQWSKSLDLICNDLYPLPNDREGSWRRSIGADFTHSLMRGLARSQPWFLMECSPSSVNWAKVNKLKRPGVHLQETLQAVANGADAIHYFQWRKGRGGFEKYHGAVIDHAGGPGTRVFEECADVGRNLEALSSISGHSVEDAPVAMVYDWESHWALQASAGPKGPNGGNGDSGNRYGEACHEHFRALRSAGVEVDIVAVDTDFSRYSVVVTPALYLLSEETAKRLEAFVKEGGIWLATYLTGYVGPSNLCWRGGFPGPGLRKLFGLWNEEVDYVFDDEIVYGRFSSEGTPERFEIYDVVERIHAEGAHVHASVDSEFYAGSPLILGNAVESGCTYYVGGRIEEAALIELYRNLCDKHGVSRQELPRGVIRKTRRGSNGPVEFVFNYNRCATEVDLGNKQFQSASDGKAYTGVATLEPYGTFIALPEVAKAQP